MSASLLSTTKAPAPKTRPVKEYSAEQFFETFSIINSSFSYDEKSILFTSSKPGVFNAFSVSVDGGPPRQLTQSPRAIYAVSYFPTDDRILFVRDAYGNENHHLYVLEPDGHQRELTTGDSVKARFLGWSIDGRHLYYESNERDSQFFDVYQMDLATFTPELLFENSVGFKCHSVSNDRKYIVFEKGTPADSNVYLFNVETKEMRNLTSHQGKIAFRPACFDPNSRNLFYLSDENSEFSYIASVNLETNERSVVYTTAANVQAVRFSRNGKYQLILIDKDGRTTFKIIDCHSGKAVQLPRFPGGYVKSVTFSKSERLIALYTGGDRNPSTLYVYEFASAKLRKLVESLSPVIDANDLVESRSVRYTSFDALEIPSFLWKPHQAKTHKVPGLVWVHGGPGGQTRKGYSPRIQFLVNHGYAVLGVNYRGSAGYGKSFLAADERKHAQDPLKDCIEGKRYLSSLDFVDSSKIGIIGASYGGYLVLAAMAFTPKEFTCGVDLFGVSNWLRMMESFPPYWKPKMDLYYQKIGDPRTEQTMLRAISPLFHANNITQPLMIVQGANDPRVLRAEADDMVAAIRENNGNVEYLVFDDEGHGITRRANRIITYGSILKFLDRYLKGDGNYQDLGRTPE